MRNRISLPYLPAGSSCREEGPGIFRFSETEVLKIEFGRFFAFLEMQRPTHPGNWGQLTLLFPRYMDRHRQPYLSEPFRDFSTALIQEFPFLGYALSVHHLALWNIALSLVDQLFVIENPKLHSFCLRLEINALTKAVEKLMEEARQIAFDCASSKILMQERESQMRLYFERMYQSRVAINTY